MRAESPNRLQEVTLPVERIPSDSEEDKPAPGIALCLSGGGYRAMLFHVGALLRMNEFGYLPKLDRISSVSGGSITAGTLGLHWNELAFDSRGISQRLRELVAEPIRRLGSTTIDVRSILRGLFGPGTVADQIIGAYRKHLFGDATLQNLPDRPRFVINATNVQSKALWRFSKPYMRDYRVGEVKNPTTSLAVAVGASSAFPPVLSPVELELRSSDFTPGSGLDLQREPFTTDVVLTDGGVYDNLGLETAWKRYDTILVSDAGGMYETEATPQRDWLNHTKRVFDLVDNQVRGLRKRQLIGSFEARTRKGAYWGIWTDIKNYRVGDALNCPAGKTAVIAGTPTRLKALDAVAQERLINWGYAVCDAAMRKHVESTLPAPSGFPYPGSGIG